MKNYHSIKELFQASEEEHCSIGELACRAEAEENGKTEIEIWARMRNMLLIFRESVKDGLSDTRKSPSGLVGGDGKKILDGEPLFLSEVCRKAAAYGVACAEANAKMYRIVACPTAGSCGILPAVLLAVGEMQKSSVQDMTRALLTASAFGKVVAENACIAGAVGGCQAECGTACAMAAAAVVDLMGGTKEQMGNAFALALKNILGLVCDPLGGLVEIPCVKRNGFHAVHALTAAEMALSGVKSMVPPDEVIEAMNDIGRRLPTELKETSLAGLAMTPTGQRVQKELEERSRKV